MTFFTTSTSIAVSRFSTPPTRPNPSVSRRLETRALVKTDAGWYGATYRWRDDYSDADLLTRAFTEDVPVRRADGTVGVQSWTYPSPSDCLTCHNDFSTGAGDFAEAFAVWQVGGSTHSRVAGPVTGGDLERLERLAG